MTIVIAARDELGPVTRLLASHPEWHYRTRAGAGGTIVVDVQVPDGTYANGNGDKA